MCLLWSMGLPRANILVIDDDIDVLVAVHLLLKNEVQKVITKKIPKIFRHC